MCRHLDAGGRGASLQGGILAGGILAGGGGHPCRGASLQGASLQRLWFFLDSACHILAFPFLLPCVTRDGNANSNQNPNELKGNLASIRCDN